MEEKPHVNIEVYIAGLNFHQHKNVKDRLEVGMELDLVPDPTNKYDPTAVGIWWDGNMLGFVPAKTGEAKLVFRLLAKEIPLEALVIKHEPEAVVHRRVKISIKNREEVKSIFQRYAKLDDKRDIWGAQTSEDDDTPF